VRPPQAGGGLQPLVGVSRRHADVGDDHVRALGLDRLVQTREVTAGGHHLDGGLATRLQQATHALADKEVVLRQHGPDRHRGAAYARATAAAINPGVDAAAPARLRHWVEDMRDRSVQGEQAAVRVLIVDDQASFRRAARRVVALLPGFEVAGEAESGEGAVEAARALRPDLVLMDVHLPGINGLQATVRILADARGAGSGHGSAPSDSNPVVLLLSTYDVADYGPRATACGAAAYLPKGEFGPAALVAAWAAAGSGRRP
jgi:CheY-like chemotaxis protein